jgi:hypothetical protein
MASPKKTANRLRLFICGLYIVQIILLTFSFMMDTTSDSAVGVSCFTLIYRCFSGGFVVQAIVALVIAIIPIAGFFVFSFDKTGNIKNIYGILSTVVAVFLIVNTVPGDSLAVGAVFSLLIYLLIVFLSVMGIFARNLRQPK